ncbi:MAG: DsbA family protein, partial [Myxococcota bacterium]
AGLDGAALVARAAEPAAKDQLRVATELAIKSGVFGVPTMRVDDELFWGLDSFAHLERHLEGIDPVYDADLERWASLPASAGR